MLTQMTAGPEIYCKHVHVLTRVIITTVKYFKSFTKDFHYESFKKFSFHVLQYSVRMNPTEASHRRQSHSGWDQASALCIDRVAWR